MVEDVPSDAARGVPGQPTLVRGWRAASSTRDGSADAAPHGGDLFAILGLRLSDAAVPDAEFARVGGLSRYDVGKGGIAVTAAAARAFAQFRRGALDDVVELGPRGLD